MEKILSTSQGGTSYHEPKTIVNKLLQDERTAAWKRFLHRASDEDAFTDIDEESNGLDVSQLDARQKKRRRPNMFGRRRFLVCAHTSARTAGADAARGGSRSCTSSCW